MRRSSIVGIALLSAALGPGCGGEDRLAGTPKDLPPGTMPQAPPLTQTPRDLATGGGQPAAGGGQAPGAPGR